MNVDREEGRSGTLWVEQAVDAQVLVREAEGEVEARGGRQREGGAPLEQLGAPGVQQRAQRQPVRPGRREVAHLHATVLLQNERALYCCCRGPGTAPRVASLPTCV